MFLLLIYLIYMCILQFHLDSCVYFQEIFVFTNSYISNSELSKIMFIYVFLCFKFIGFAYAFIPSERNITKKNGCYLCIAKLFVCIYKSCFTKRKFIFFRLDLDKSLGSIEIGHIHYLLVHDKIKIFSILRFPM